MTTDLKRSPDFAQFVAVLTNDVPERPTLYELYLNGPLYERLAGRPAPAKPDPADRPAYLAYCREAGRFYADAFAAGGYDYVTFGAGIAFPGFHFREGAHAKKRSHSLNEGALIANAADVESFRWPTASDVDAEALDALTSTIPDGMQAMFLSPCGVLENLVDLVGYDNLCFMLADDRDLVKEISRRIGDALIAFYQAITPHPRVGALIANDDWGFKTQTMVAPDDLREFVFPWYERVARMAHDEGKQILLHSCGELREVMDDVIDELKIDAKHSFEDVILPIEDVYERWGDRIAILGGIDVDFLCTASPEAITKRCRAMLERTAGRGGYALGSGNSIPDYVPQEAFFALTRAVLEP